MVVVTHVTGDKNISVDDLPDKVALHLRLDDYKVKPTKTHLFNKEDLNEFMKILVSSDFVDKEDYFQNKLNEYYHQKDPLCNEFANELSDIERKLNDLKKKLEFFFLLINY